MYRLNDDGSRIPDSNGDYVRCTKDDPNIKIALGCTAKAGDNAYDYPFNSSTVTISIEGTDGPDNDQYAVPYLWDVVAREYGLNGSQGSKPAAGVKAQAVAARTYLYDRILRNFPANNSASGFQVFMPYAYAKEGGDSLHRDTMLVATNDQLYMTPAQDNPNTTDYDESIYPIPAFFGADNLLATTQGTPEGAYTDNVLTNYIRSVADPINETYGCWIDDFNQNGLPDKPGEFPTSNADPVCGTPWGGLSSKGASRWAFGHTSSRGPVADTHPNYPHDDSGNGDFWSVRWENAFQILTHYYTGIHIRDAGNGNAVKTPAYRWVPLRIVAPTSTCANANVPVELWLQNTGTAEWAANTIIAVITNLTATPAAVTTPQANEIPTAVPVGDTVVITRTVRPTFAGVFTYSVDFYTAAVGLFSQQTPAWPRYEQFTLEAVDCHAHLYLPTVQTGRISTVQAQSNNQAAPALDQAQWLPLIMR